MKHRLTFLTLLCLTVRVIKNGRVEFPNLSDAPPTLEPSNSTLCGASTIDAKRQLVEKKLLVHRSSCVRGVIYPTRYSGLRFVFTQFSDQFAVLNTRQSHVIKGTGAINSTFTFGIARTVSVCLKHHPISLNTRPVGG